MDGPIYMPDGKPCPEVLTPAEAVRFLRLDVDGLAKPENTLRYYRDKKKLKGTKIGKHVRYTRKALAEFLEKMTNG